MSIARTCAECGASLPAGLPDVFCPACALRRALAVGSPLPPVLTTANGRSKRWPVGWLRRLFSRNEPNKSPQHPLAAGDDLAKQPWPTSEIASIPVPGEVIEDYEILEKIGGNMGWVFKARHRLLNKVVALKLLPAEWMADSNRLERFEREIRALGQLEHPNLVTAADARRMDSWYFVVMEWIEGLDLHQLVKAHGPLPISAACEAARQAALGLQFAHEHGLIHRDIKPSNLMLSVTGIVKVIDMGLALANESTSAQLTQTGQVMGTMSYCAPEQFRDASTVDIRADIYSLGCTLYHLVVGRAPYGHRKSITEVMQAHLNEPFPNLRDARPDAPEDLETLLKRMTEKNPDARFSTPCAVAEALERFATGADLKPLVPERTEQNLPVRAKSDKTLLPPKGHRIAGRLEPQPKVPRQGMAALLVVLLAIAGAIFLTMTRPKGDAVAPIGRPLVVVMDTTAERGVYDEANKGKGITNGEELKNVLRDLLVTVQSEAVSINWTTREWRGEARVLAAKPALVLLHRSVFFHPVNAELDFKYPPFTNTVAYAKWKILYDMCDIALFSFLGNIGALSPQTRFLVYSRGTDVNWTDANFRTQWVKDIEARFPWLKGRVSTMWIREGKDGSKGFFKNPETAEDIRARVKAMLGMPEGAR